MNTNPRKRQELLTNTTGSNLIRIKIQVLNQNCTWKDIPWGLVNNKIS